MTIKRRLILLLCLLSVAILAMALMGGWALYRADLGATRIYHERVVTMHDLSIISNLYEDNVHNAGLRFAADRATLGETARLMRAARDRAFALWRSHRDMQMARTEAQLSQEVEAGMRDIDVQIDALVTAAGQHGGALGHDDKDSVSRVTGEIEPDLDRLTGLLTSLSDAQLSIGEQDYQAAHSNFSWGLVGVLGAALAAVLGLALVVLMVIRRVTQPLTEALLAEVDILRRESAVTVPANAGVNTGANAGEHLTAETQPRDEISAVIDTLRRFRRNLNDLSSAQAAQAREAGIFRAQLEAIFRHAPVGVYIKDLDGHMLVVSDAAAKLWGHTHDEMIGKIDTTWSQPDEAALIQASNRQVIETGTAITVEYRGQAPNTYDWLLAVKFPVRDEAGKIVSLGGFDMDISDSRRQVEELRLASAQLQNVKRMARMCYWSSRVDAVSGAVKSYNIDRELIDLTGRAEIPSDGRGYANEVIHPADRAAIIAVYDDFAAHKLQTYQIEYRIQRPDGGIVSVRAWVERMRDSANGDFLIAGVVQDITAEKQREAQLMAAKTEAEASDRAKSEFLTNMSHELRTPLNAVIGYSDLLRMNDIVQHNSQISGYVDAVNESGRNLLEIINAILDMSRLESTDPLLQETVFPLAEAIAEIERLIRMRADSKGITLHLPQIAAVPAGSGAKDIAADGAMANGSMAEGISGGPLDPDLKIRAELRAFRQILLNVLSNAIKFTGPGGSVTLALALRATGDLAIEVSDTGVGIDANLVPLLTIPFTQAGSAWTRRKGGIGLGLAIAKKLLDLHQGSIEVDSRPGSGTRITLVFPAARLQTGTMPAADTAAAAKPGDRSDTRPDTSQARSS